MVIKDKKILKTRAIVLNGERVRVVGDTFSPEATSHFTVCSIGTSVMFIRYNPLTAKLFNLNFHPLEDVSRWRDPQLQVSENYTSNFSR